MAKDPAVLFYTQDFITGTMFMSNEEVGIYIRLLCAQHQHGGLIEKESFNCLVGDHKLVRAKFIESDEGFFNERLMKEMNKRLVKSTNLSLNAKKRWDKHCKSNAIAYNRHDPIENENESENVIKDIKRFTAPAIVDVVAYCIERKNQIDPERFHNFYESKGWKVGNQKMKDWKAAVRNWEKQTKDFNKLPDSVGFMSKPRPYVDPEWMKKEVAK